MKILNFNNFKLNEITNSKNLISVDIQPAYNDWINFSVTELLEWIKEKKFNHILWLYNGAEMGYEDEDEINAWLMDKVVDYETDEWGESFEFFSNTRYFEKGYGFFRDLMDTISDNDIVEIGKYMIKNDMRDMRDFQEEDIEYLTNKGLEEEYLNGDNYSFYINDVKDDLNYLRGSEITIVGGGQLECLLEIELLMQMLEIPYKIENSYVY